jgi:hypothetical protein
MPTQSGYEPEELTFEKRNPQTIMLSDGVRIRKTDTGYVIETLRSDNTTWTELVGSTPYSEITLDPVQYTTAPFYDPTFVGPGFPTGILAPGANKLIWPLYVDSFPSLGDPVDSTPELYLCWKDATSAESTGKFSDGMADFSGDPLFTNIQRWIMLGEAGDLAVPRGLSGAYMIENVNADVINQPLVIVRGGAQVTGGSRSITYRIYYQIIDVPSFT